MVSNGGYDRNGGRINICHFERWIAQQAGCEAMKRLRDLHLADLVEAAMQEYLQ